MKKLALSTLLVALVAAGPGCSKNKKAATEPSTTATTTDTSGPSTDRTSADTSGSDTVAAKPPSLGPVIYFEFDQSGLSPEARAELQQNAEWMQADPNRTLTIEGHTDEVGTAEYNVALGERRANAARDYLISLGIDASRIKVITFGEERPASDVDSENRRAMFVATKK